MTTGAFLDLCVAILPGPPAALPSSPKCHRGPVIQSADQRAQGPLPDIQRVSDAGVSEQGLLSDSDARRRVFSYEICLTLLPLTFQFGLSLLYALLSQGEKLLSSGVPLEPSIGDFETWYADLRGASLFQRDDVCLAVFRTDSIFQVAGQLTQCSLVEPLLLPSNLLTLFCRYLDKRTVHQLKSNME